MPGSMGRAQLDVQFGNWDVPSSTGYLPPSAVVDSGLSFTADLEPLYNGPAYG